MFNGIESFHWLWAGPRAAGTCCQMAGSLDGGGHVAPNSLHRWSNFLAAAEGSEGPESSESSESSESTESTDQDQKWWELTMHWCKLERFHSRRCKCMALCDIVWYCYMLLMTDLDWSYLMLWRSTDRIGIGEGSRLQANHRLATSKNAHTHTHTRQEWIIIWSGRNWILKHADWKKWQVRHWTSPVISVSHASLFVGLVLAWTTSPPALKLERERTKEEKEKEVLHLFRCYTHTHPAGAGSTLKGKRKKKGGHTTGRRPKTAQGGEGNRRTSGTNLHGETDLTQNSAHT